MSDIEFKFGIKSIKNGESTKLCSILNITPDSFPMVGNILILIELLREQKSLFQKVHICLI